MAFALCYARFCFGVAGVRTARGVTKGRRLGAPARGHARAAPVLCFAARLIHPRRARLMAPRSPPPALRATSPFPGEDKNQELWSIFLVLVRERCERFTSARGGGNILLRSISAGDSVPWAPKVITIRFWQSSPTVPALHPGSRRRGTSGRHRPSDASTCPGSTVPASLPQDPKLTVRLCLGVSPADLAIAAGPPGWRCFATGVTHRYKRISAQQALP